MHFGLSEEQEMIVSTVRSFVEKEIYPHEAEVERTGHVPHELGLEILHEAGTYDRLDVCNVVCVELLLRLAQLSEHDYAREADGHSVGKVAKARGNQAKTPAPGGMRVGSPLDDAAAFGGLSRDRGEIMVCPELLEFVTREERRLSAKPSGGGGGKGP